MERQLLAGATLACVLAVGHWAWAQQTTFVQDDGVKWGPASAALPSGAQPAVKPGGFLQVPKGVQHFAWASQNTVVQLHGVGPGGFAYVDAADDPRKK
jgi:hypothetical protein